MSVSQLAQQECCDEARRGDCCGQQLQAACVCGAVGACCSDEGLATQSADCNCLTAEASGRLAGLDDSIDHIALFDADATELVAANAAGVVAAGSGCCPTAELGTVGQQDAERVLRVECLDLVPTNCCGGERVGHADTLVANDELGAEQSQPGNRNQENRPGPNGRTLPLADHHGQGNKNNHCCQSDAAPRPNNLRVSHASIIAGDVK